VKPPGAKLEAGLQSRNVSRRAGLRNVAGQSARVLALADPGGDLVGSDRNHWIAATETTDRDLKDRISIRNARQNNLKGIDVDLPRRSLIVVTGPSGSGKSSLAFDTLYAEGQRRYVESLSTYAKQFLERMEKPLVDSIDGISPAVAIEQKNPTKTSRSTVGTATEVYDYLRLLWARAGRTRCPECGRHVTPDTVQSITDAVLREPDGTRILVTFPLPRSARISHARIVDNLRALGFIRLRVEGDNLELDSSDAETPAGAGLDLADAEEVLVVVDRLAVRQDARDRLADSVATALSEGEGELVIVHHADGRRVLFTERFRCPDHPGIRFLDPTPRLFSFNNPYGSCPECTGFGAVLEYDPALIIPNAQRSLRDGAVDPWEKPRYSRQRRKLLAWAREQGEDPDAPWETLPKRFRDVVLKGKRGFQGVIPFMRSREKKRYKQYIRVFLRQYQTAMTCPACDGRKLRPEALFVEVAGTDIARASATPIRELRDWVNGLDVTPDAGVEPALGRQERDIAAPILRELRARLEFLADVGLGYLTLNRQTRTLSGGEAQRISLANSLGSSLVDTLYVLDEPTVGLHPRDTDRLLALLRKLRDSGNTVVVVEHDQAAIRAADYIVELGPGSGEKGGSVVYAGDVDGLLASGTATGEFLTRDSPPPPAGRHPRVQRRVLRLRGARLHNLQGVDVDIPLGMLTVVSGVSGSGKSTLVHDVLYRALEKELDDETSAKRHLGEAIGQYGSIEGLAHVDSVVMVDQAPIGRSFRSNPVTYVKAFDHIREIFADQQVARERGYKAGHFSFNVKGGRCETCRGEGWVQIEMVFLADVWVPCEICNGARYTRDTLDVRFKGLNIREVLDLTVDEAIRFFIRQDRLGQMLWQLQQVGLGYLRLGQPAPSLSGGEAQRLKIARELIFAGRKRGSRLYLMDEPTTGLSGPEVHKLLQVVRRLTDAGHTVLVIEHNVHVIRAADWIIDLGPEAGEDGGRVVVMGTPADVAKHPHSRTAPYLKESLTGSAATLDGS
jgi:excinuclease ABC subunit A